jgi:hypothetical protein
MDTQTQLVYDYFSETLGKKFISRLKEDNIFKSEVELGKWLETGFWPHTYEYYYEPDFADLFPPESEYFKYDRLRDTLFELVSQIEIDFQAIAKRL